MPNKLPAPRSPPNSEHTISSMTHKHNEKKTLIHNSSEYTNTRLPLMKNMLSS